MCSWRAQRLTSESALPAVQATPVARHGCLPASQPACPPDCCPKAAAGAQGSSSSTSAAFAIPSQAQIDMLLPSNSPRYTRVESIHRWADAQHRGAAALIPTQSDVRATDTVPGWAQAASAQSRRLPPGRPAAAAGQSWAQAGAPCRSCRGDRASPCPLLGACFAAAGGEAQWRRQHHAAASTTAQRQL